MVGESRSAVEAPMNEWLHSEWDFASWSESTVDSAIMGTVDNCVEQLQAHLRNSQEMLVLLTDREQIKSLKWLRSRIIEEINARKEAKQS